MHKDRKETTHVKVGEEDIHHHHHHHIYIYISKISTMYVNMVIRPKVQEEGSKYSP